MSSYFSLRNFRTASLHIDEEMHDERLDKAVLAISLSIVGGGMVFLLAMTSLLFPEWIRVNPFAPDANISTAPSAVHFPASKAEDALDQVGPQRSLVTVAVPRDRVVERGAGYVQGEVGTVVPSKPAAAGHAAAARPAAADSGSPAAGRSRERGHAGAAAENDRPAGRKA